MDEFQSEVFNKRWERRQLNKTENYHLITDGSEESKLSIRYFVESGMLPKIHKWSDAELREEDSRIVPLVNAHLFVNSKFLDKSDLPCLIVDEGASQWGYRSFFGIKSF